jgi:predicted amidophosphoribosyltransferase
MIDLRHTINLCESCRAHTELSYYPERDEYLCDNCVSNINEAAAERQYEDFHDGDSSWPDLRREQENARKLK